MKKNIVMAVVILLASCGAGAVARSVWYNADSKFPEMPWVKGGAPTNNTKPTPPPVVKDGDKDSSEPNGGHVAKGPAVVESGGTNGHASDDASATTPKADACACGHQVEGFCVAEIDCVLKHMKAGTAFIVDAREDHDFDEAHLAGSIHVPSSAIYDNMERIMAVVPTQQNRIIVYCGGGQCEASKNVGLVLREFGYSNVWLYEKGWEEVEASGRFGDFIEIGG